MKVKDVLKTGVIVCQVIGAIGGIGASAFVIQDKTKELNDLRAQAETGSDVTTNEGEA